MKIYLIPIVLIISLSYAGCASLKKPAAVMDRIIMMPSAYIETLKHPTEFPVEYLPEVFDIEGLLKDNPLGEGEAVKILLVGESKLASTHFVQVRKDAEIDTHYHKAHDETVYVKKGRGIAILNGTRYVVQPGTVLQIPNNTIYRFINTGGELFASVSVFTPPSDGKDIIYVKEEKEIEQVSEVEKEMRREEKAKKKAKRQGDKLAVVEEGKGGDIDEGDHGNTSGETAEIKKDDTGFNKDDNIYQEGAITSDVSSEGLDGNRGHGYINPDDVPVSLPPGGVERERSEAEALARTPSYKPVDQYMDKGNMYEKGRDILDYPGYETETDNGNGLYTGEKDTFATEQPTRLLQHEEGDQVKTDLDQSLFGGHDESGSAPFVYEREEDILGDLQYITGEDEGDEMDYEDIPEYTRGDGRPEDDIFVNDSDDMEDRLKELDELREAGLITEKDYKSKKAELSGVDDF